MILTFSPGSEWLSNPLQNELTSQCQPHVDLKDLLEPLHGETSLSHSEHLWFSEKKKKKILL